MDRVHGDGIWVLQHSESISTVKLAIDGHDLISWRVIFRSNPLVVESITDGAQPAEAVGAACDGGSRWCHGRQCRLTGVRPRACHSSPNSTWFAPTGSQQDGDSVLLTLKRRRAAWRAGGSISFAKTRPLVCGSPGGSPARPRPQVASLDVS
jgi:hypothetical protein